MNRSELGILPMMHPHLLISLFMLALASVSTTAHANGPCESNGLHTHVHKHGATAHLHTHANPYNHPLEHCSHTCDDDGHEDCCGDHNHYPEQTGNLLFSRGPELPTTIALMNQPLADAWRSDAALTAVLWAPLRQRPPDYLESLRSIVMLN